MATLYRTDGTEQDLTPANGRSFTGEELRAAVGGYIEVIRLGVTTDGWRAFIVDEEGKLKDKPLNRAATEAWAVALPPGHLVDVLVGDVLFCTVAHPGRNDERIY